MTDAIYLGVSEKTEAAKTGRMPGFRLRNVEIFGCLSLAQDILHGSIT